MSRQLDTWGKLAKENPNLMLFKSGQKESIDKYFILSRIRISVKAHSMARLSNTRITHRSVKKVLTSMATESLLLRENQQNPHKLTKIFEESYPKVQLISSS